MNNKTLLLIGTIPAVGLILYLVSRGLASRQYALSITHSGSGTLDIEDGTHSYPSPTQVLITATPDSGYQANWNLNGLDVEQGVNQYSLYVNGVNSLAVSFVPIGGGPTQPTGIRAVGTIGTLQNFRFWFPFATGGIDLAECDENWNDGICQAGKMIFKVYDASGRGVPNILVQIYPEINPDATPYKGTVYMGTMPFPYTTSNPLILTTDVDGLASFPVFNRYSADDITANGGGIELSRGTQVYADKFCLLAGSVRVMPISKGLPAGVSCFWTGGGGGGTISYNKIIRADIIATDKTTIQSITVNYGVKWKA